MPVSSSFLQLSKEQITKALTRLRICADWSASLLFTCSKSLVLSTRPICNIIIPLIALLFGNTICNLRSENVVTKGTFLSSVPRVEH